jgi:putative ABC transport system permease protein
MEIVRMYVVDNVLNLFSMSMAFTLIGLNVYLTTKVLNITDLTCDASVSLGGCAYGALVVCGMNPLASFIFATFLGILAGFVTSSFVSHINIDPVLSSIITLTALQTFITKLSHFKKLNIARENSPLSILSSLDNCIVVAVAVTIICCIFYRILRSEYGLAMRACGGGRIIAESLGISTNRMLCAGLGLGNALSAAAGALMVQISGDFCSGLGNGALVFGLAAVIIGERVLAPKSIHGAILGCFFGSLMYKTMLELATFGGSEAFGSEYNNIIISIVLIFLMALIQDSKRKTTLKNI